MEKAEKLDRVRELLEERYGRLETWPNVAQGAPPKAGHEYLRQIARNGREPPEDTLDRILRWLEGPTPLGNIQPPTPAERERLTELLMRLSSLLEEGYLPERVWSGERNGLPKSDTRAHGANEESEGAA